MQKQYTNKAQSKSGLKVVVQKDKRKSTSAQEDGTSSHSMPTHKTLVFFTQAIRQVKDHLWMSLEMLEIKFIPRIQYCPRCNNPFSNSCQLSFLYICWNSSKKSKALLLHFCVQPLNKAHMFCANGHFHQIWLTVSDW